MALIITAPDSYDFSARSCFLAGGIIGCPDWRKQLIDLLSHTDIVFLNPRRNPDNEEQQVFWEWYHSRNATAIAFWFCKETMQPVSLFELGRWSSKHKPIFVGIDPDYEMKKNLELQLKFERPDLKIVYSLDDLAQQITQ